MRTVGKSEAIEVVIGDGETARTQCSEIGLVLKEFEFWLWTWERRCVVVILLESEPK